MGKNFAGSGRGDGITLGIAFDHAVGSPIKAARVRWVGQPNGGYAADPSHGLLAAGAARPGIGSFAEWFLGSAAHEQGPSGMEADPLAVFDGRRMTEAVVAD